MTTCLMVCSLRNFGYARYRSGCEHCLVELHFPTPLYKRLTSREWNRQPHSNLLFTKNIVSKLATPCSLAYPVCPTYCRVSFNQVFVPKESCLPNACMFPMYRVFPKHVCSKGIVSRQQIYVRSQGTVSSHHMYVPEVLYLPKKYC